MTAKDKSIPNEDIVINSTALAGNETQINSRRFLWTIAAIVLVCLLSGILIGTYITLKIQHKDPIEPDEIILSRDPYVKGCPHKVRIVNRSNWLARPPAYELTPLEMPATRVIIAHTASYNCTTQVECTHQVQRFQRYHIESRKWADIAYNFLVGGDGAVYVGRGWTIQGAHTKGFNVKSICIAFIGTYNAYAPTEEQLCTAKKLIAGGVMENKLTADYALYGHLQFISTESPGRELYKIIQTWEHWTDRIN